jgi:hypothetical protein
MTMMMMMLLLLLMMMIMMMRMMMIMTLMTRVKPVKNLIVFRGMLELEQAVRRVMVTDKFSGRIIFYINLFA